MFGESKPLHNHQASSPAGFLGHPEYVSANIFVLIFIDKFGTGIPRSIVIGVVRVVGFFNQVLVAFLKSIRDVFEKKQA